MHLSDVHENPTQVAQPSTGLKIGMSPWHLFDKWDVSFRHVFLSCVYLAGTPHPRQVIAWIDHFAWHLSIVVLVVHEAVLRPKTYSFA